jgi:hypothetical protein
MIRNSPSNMLLLFEGLLAFFGDAEALGRLREPQSHVRERHQPCERLKRLISP